MPEATLRTFLQRQLPVAPGVRRLVVGLSGGLDSSVLLQALARVAPEFGLPLRAVHVHHGLSPHADAWAEQVTRFCAQKNVPLTVHRVQVRRAASLEAAARTARYEAFATRLAPEEVLVLAQHRDDQAETLLFRLLRGAGVTGLGAMHACRSFHLAEGGAIPQWRPLLTLPRTALLAYAQAQGLHWIEDESNTDLRHARNFLRHAILPRLRERWPAALEKLAATALRLQEADALLQEFAAGLAKTCVDAGQCLVLPAFGALSPPQQRLLLRYWLRQQGFLLPDEAVLEKILTDVIPARVDAEPQLVWSGCEIRRYRDRLHALVPLPPLPEGWEQEWSAAAPLPLPDGRVLVAASAAARVGPWQVRYRRGGERIRPAPGQASRELKTVLQEQGVPPWQRERLPLIFRDGELRAVAGLELAGTDAALRFRVDSSADAE